MLWQRGELTFRFDRCTCTFRDIVIKNVKKKNCFLLWCHDKDSVGFWFCCHGFLLRGGEKKKLQVAGWTLRYDVGSTPSGRALFKWPGPLRKLFLFQFCPSIESSRSILWRRHVTAAAARLGHRRGSVASSPRPQSHCPLPWCALNTWWTTWACPRFASWGFPPGPSSRRRSQITATPALGGTERERAKVLFVKM